MFTEEERAKWRKMFEEWKKTGESPWNAGIRKEQSDATTVQRQKSVQPIKRTIGKSVVPQKWIEKKQKEQPVISQDTYTRKRVAQETKRTWRSDAADIAHSVGEGALLATSLINPEGSIAVNAAYNTAKNAVASLPKTLPVSNMERRAIEVLLRSTGGKGSGISPYEIKKAVLANKKHSANVFKYITTGKGNAKSLVPGDQYTGFRVHQGWDLPSIKLPSDNDKYGDIIDAILYNKQVNPEYGLIPSNEPLYDFGLTPSAIKRYTGVQKYKVMPRDNFRGFGNTIPPTQYKDITDKHLPIVYDDYGKATRPTSISVATSDNIGADLGHYDMQIGTLNGDNVYRWQDIYEFNPKAYKKSWDLYDSDFGGDSKLTMKLKNIFLDRLDKAHTPITIQRDWFGEPHGWSSENYGFTLVP